MLPTLFSIGPFHLYTYGLMFALGVLAAITYLGRLEPVGGLTRNQMIDLILMLTFVGVAGARAFYVFQSWDYFRLNPAEIFAVWQGGLVVYGGVIASLAGLIVFCLVRRISFLALADFYFPAVALAQAFGRIGCFLNGCCWGSVSHLPWAVHYPFLKDPVHPVQIYSSLFDFALFGFLAWRYPRRKFDGEIAFFYFVIYGLGRFMVEYLRGDNLPVLWGLTEAQIISGIIVFLACAVVRKISK